MESEVSVVVSHKPLTLVLSSHSPRDFSLSPQNQEESDPRHLGDLSDILRSHFDEKQLGVPPYPGARVVSRQRPVGRGVCHLRKFKNAILKMLMLVWSWNLLCMLEMSFPSFISQNPDEILIFGTFLAKFSILANVLLKIGYFEVWRCLWLHCDLIHVRCVNLFRYVWKEETHSYIIVPISRIWGFGFQVHGSW